MAIAKVQYKENASATPEVWMDTTQKTVTAGTMLSGTTALKNDGTGITGNIASKSSSDITASGATVTAPAGYYPNAASKSVATTTHPNPTASINAATGVVTASHTQTAGYVAAGTTTGTLPLTTQAAKTVAPTESEQTAVSAGVYTTGAVKVGAISSTYVGSDVAQNDSSDLTASGATVTAPAGFYAESASKTVASGSASTPATSITTNPTISVNASGLITASVSGSKSVTPTVSAGYVSAGTAGTVSVSGSNTQQLTAKAATTYYPSTTDQTIASGQYLTGTQTIKAVTTTNLTAENIADGVTVEVGDASDSDRILSITGTHQGGTTPTGVKYIYTDIDGDGAWDVSGYQYCSVDYAPLNDGKLRYWLKVTQDSLAVAINYYMSSSSGVPRGSVNWGDGSIDNPAQDSISSTHNYTEPGIYCVEIDGGSGTRLRTYSYAAGNGISTNDSKLVAVEVVDRESTKKVDSSAFRNCLNLKKVSFGDDILMLGTYSFSGSGISELTIPASITNIANNCFQKCASLLKIHLEPMTPPALGSSVFNNTPSNLVIYVPQGYLEAYQTATNWSAYASKMQEEP